MSDDSAVNVNSPEKVVRRVDDLGRVAIPKVYREKLGIKAGDALEIHVDEPSGMIVLQRLEEKEN